MEISAEPCKGLYIVLPLPRQDILEALGESSIQHIVLMRHVLICKKA